MPPWVPYGLVFAWPLFCQSPRLGKIGFAYLSSFCSGPFLKPHFIYQAKIENLNVMGKGIGLIGIGMKLIAWEIIAVPAQLMAFCFAAFISSATMLFTKNMLLQWYLPIMRSTSATFHDSQWNLQFIRPLFNLLRCIFIGIHQKKSSVETVQATWGCKMSIIHSFPPLQYFLFVEKTRYDDHLWNSFFQDPLECHTASAWFYLFQCLATEGFCLKNNSLATCSTLLKGQAKFMHLLQRNSLRVVKKPRFVRTKSKSRNQESLNTKNGRGYPQTIVIPAKNQNFSVLFIGPGRYFHSFGEPWLAQQLKVDPSSA